MFSAATIATAPLAAVGQALWSRVAAEPDADNDGAILAAALHIARRWSWMIVVPVGGALAGVAYHYSRSLPTGDIWRRGAVVAGLVLTIWVFVSLRIGPPLYFVASRGRLAEHYAFQSARALWRLVAIMLGIGDRSVAVVLIAVLTGAGDILILTGASLLTRRMLLAKRFDVPKSGSGDVSMRATSRHFLSLGLIAFVNSSVGPFVVPLVGSLSMVPEYSFVQRGAFAMVTVMQTSQGPLTNVYGKAIAQNVPALAGTTLSRAVKVSTGAAALIWISVTASAPLWGRVAFHHPRILAELSGVLLMYPTLYAPAISTSVFINATSRIRPMVYIVLGETVADVLLALLLGSLMGVYGVALGQVIAGGAISSWLVPCAAQKLGAGVSTRVYATAAAISIVAGSIVLVVVHPWT